MGQRVYLRLPRTVGRRPVTVFLSAHGVKVASASRRDSKTIVSIVLASKELARLHLSKRSGTSVAVWARSGKRRIAGGCVVVPAVKPVSSSTTPLPLAAPLSAAPSTPLQWAPPKLLNPHVIQVKNGLAFDYIYLDPSQDYIIKLPAGGLHGALELDGGHNVVLIGGSITVPATSNQTDNGADDTDQGIYVRAATGIVHIEGVSITGDPDTQFDGIDINAPQATVQLENIRVTNVWGSDTTEHADVVQTWGGVHDLRIDHLTGDGDYQGLTIDPDLGPVGSAEIENVDLTLVPRPAALAPMTVGGGYMIWLTRGVGTCTAPGAVTFKNVYVNDEDTGRVAPSNTLWPPSVRSGLPCAGALSGSQETWPSLPVTGSVSLAAPPNGPFVPAGVAGDSYASPGYVPGA